MFNPEDMNRFSEYSSLFKIKGMLNTGKLFTGEFGNKFVLSENLEVMIGVDQSTTQTGVCIINASNRVPLYIIDFINDGLPNPVVYQEMLGLMFAQMLDKCKVKLMVIEKPWGGSKYSYSVLSALKSFMQSLQFKIPALNGLKIEEVLPQSWRSRFVPSTKYKGRLKGAQIKLTVQEECIARFPMFREYSYTSNKVQDSFEAMGIIYGYLDLAFTEQGVKKINTTMSKGINHDYVYKFFWGNKINDLNKSLEFMKQDRGVAVVEFNPDMSISDNSARITQSSNKYALMKIKNDITKIQAMWYTGEVIGNNDNVYLMAVRCNRSNKLD